MTVFRHYSDLPDDARGAVVAIGNFDGIHRGHQAVIKRARDLAADYGSPHAVVTFEPHPRSYFAPDTPPFILTPFRIKARLIDALGVDHLFVLPFNEALAAMTATEFVEQVLVEGLAVRHVVVGDDFGFGAGRQGNVTVLKEHGERLGFGVTVVDRVNGPGDEIYSSTRAREYLKAGNPTRAALVLGRYFEIEGRVQPGDRRGHDLGYPTANIEVPNIALPAYGVYAIRAGIDRGAETIWHAGVANFGIRPMFRSDEPLLEAHLFDFNDDIYGLHVRVAFVDYLRPELDFDNIEDLKAQMDEDARRAKVILTAEDWDASWPAGPFMSVGAAADP